MTTEPTADNLAQRQQARRIYLAQALGWHTRTVYNGVDDAESLMWHPKNGSIRDAVSERDLPDFEETSRAYDGAYWREQLRRHLRRSGFCIVEHDEIGENLTSCQVSLVNANAPSVEHESDIEAFLQAAEAALNAMQQTQEAGQEKEESE